MGRGLEADKILRIVENMGIPLASLAKTEVPGRGQAWVCAALQPYPTYTREAQEGGKSVNAGAQALGSIAPFAARNRYRELSRRLMKAAAELRREAGDKPSEYRVLCNSHIPEKPLAVRAGLGFLGRNSLLINPDYGSRCLIGLLVLPFEIDAPETQENTEAHEERLRPGAGCGSCRLCVEACPAKAIRETGGIIREFCLQDWASRPEPLPEAYGKIWGRRIYGCEDCQEVCPHNKGKRLPEESPLPMKGDLGSEIPLSTLLDRSDEELRAFLKGTALGMSWIPVSALKRNALFAAGNSGARELKLSVERYASSLDPALRQAAEYALGKIDNPIA